MHTADNALVVEDVSFTNLETFNNNGGWISLVDGGNNIDNFTMGPATQLCRQQWRLVAVDGFLADRHLTANPTGYSSTERRAGTTVVHGQPDQPDRQLTQCDSGIPVITVQWHDG